MAYIDIELDDFDTADLLEELQSRVGRIGHMSEKQQESFRLMFRRILNDSAPTPFQLNTLDDQLKTEHLQKVWNKYTWAQIVDLLPE